MAEVYWGLGPRLCDAGFDFAYDKELYDALVEDDLEKVLPKLLRDGTNCFVAVGVQPQLPHALKTEGDGFCIYKLSIMDLLPGHDERGHGEPGHGHNEH